MFGYLIVAAEAATDAWRQVSYYGAIKADSPKLARLDLTGKLSI
jgi:hypothetical protein